MRRDKSREVARLPLLHGKSLGVNYGGLHQVRLLNRPKGSPWLLSFERRFGDRYAALSDLEGVNALALLLPIVNRFGGSKRDREAAVAMLEGDPNPMAQIEQAARYNSYLDSLPRAVRLALEMAAHEDAERATAAGQLALLELAWREAESVAAVADSLLIPNEVHNAWLRLKQGSRPLEVGKGA